MAASGPTKCIFCYQAKPSFSIVQERVGARLQFICQECIQTEKFTVANLITMLKDNGIEEGVDMESIREMAFIKPYKIPEVLADISYETLGFLILEICLICGEKIKQNMNYCALEKHNEDKHADEIASAILKKCNDQMMLILEVLKIILNKTYSPRLSTYIFWTGIVFIIHYSIHRPMESSESIAKKHAMTEIRKIKRRIKEELERKSKAISPWTKTHETSDLKDYWDSVVPVTMAVLKTPQMTSPSSWIDAIQCVHMYSHPDVDVNLTIYFNLFEIIETHASEIKQNLAQENRENLLETYCVAWNVYQNTSKNILTLFSRFNERLVRCTLEMRDAITGSNYLTVENMVKSAWYDHILEPITGDIGILVWRAINGEGEVARVQEVVQSFEEVGALDFFDTFFLEELEKHYISEAKEQFEGMNAANFLKNVLHQIQTGKMFPDSSISKLQEVMQNKLSMQGFPNSVEQQPPCAPAAVRKHFSDNLKSTLTMSSLAKNPRLNVPVACPEYWHDEVLKQTKQHLFSLLHAQNCSQQLYKCPYPDCWKVKNALCHMDSCIFDAIYCDFPLCASYKHILRHWHECVQQDCPVCLQCRQHDPGTAERETGSTHAAVQESIVWSPVWSPLPAHIERLMNGSEGPALINAGTEENWPHPPQQKDSNNDRSEEIPESPIQKLWHVSFQRNYDMSKATGFQDSDQKTPNCVLKTLRESGLYDTVLGPESHYGRNLNRHLHLFAISATAEEPKLILGKEHRRRSAPTRTAV
ncbi:Hypothetical predicted protein [Cloeon dipterum]|uniref:histone acetyltransferase n=1 Tax=Cloeon dipterum TaxID=197152 RepID=A0A8S1DZM2_9INSE|nr:Hypothetical predicted protein [Cloeon dipterum]